MGDSGVGPTGGTLNGCFRPYFHQAMIAGGWFANYLGQNVGGPDRVDVGGLSYKFSKYNQGKNGCRMIDPDPTVSLYDFCMARIAQFLPQAMIVSIGGNDIVTAMTLAQFAANDSLLFNLLLTGNVPVFMYANLPPPYNDVASVAKTDSANVTRAAMVAASAAHLVDINTPIRGADGTIDVAYRGDYPHVNDAGWAAVGAAHASAMLAVL